MTLLDIDGTHNFRDTGGIALAAGGTTRPGVLYRSDALGALTPAGLRAFAATPIGVVVDFRSEAERTRMPDVLPEDRPIRTVLLPLLEGAMTGAPGATLPGGDASNEALAAAIEALPTLADLYTSMLEHGGHAFAEVARLIAMSEDDAPSAVLVHCTAGKDRTGVASALMLDAAGADRAAVVADYASTAANLAGPWAERMRAMVTGMGVPLAPKVDELLTGSPATAIEHALAWVDERGGSAAYLEAAGVTGSDLERLRERITG